jgi:hypothetical protein
LIGSAGVIYQRVPETVQRKPKLVVGVKKSTR